MNCSRSSSIFVLEKVVLYCGPNFFDNCKISHGFYVTSFCGRNQEPLNLSIYDLRRFYTTRSSMFSEDSILYCGPNIFDDNCKISHAFYVTSFCGRNQEPLKLSIYVLRNSIPLDPL